MFLVSGLQEGEGEEASAQTLHFQPRAIKIIKGIEWGVSIPKHSGCAKLGFEISSKNLAYISCLVLISLELRNENYFTVVVFVVVSACPEF